MLNLAAVLEHSAKELPEKTAVVYENERFTYKQVNTVANQVANGLTEAGIGKGDKVAFSCPNNAYFPMVYYGILKVGAVVVPLNVLLKSREIAYHLKDSDAKAYFCFQDRPDLPMAREGWAGFIETPGCEHFWMIADEPQALLPADGIATLGQFIANQPPEFDTVSTRGDDAAVILYTSGTTGFPKGAELTHANMTLNALLSKDIIDLKPDDVHALVLPLFHSFGQTCQMNAGFFCGNTLVMGPRFSPEAVLGLMQEEKVTVFVGVPTMYWALLNYEDRENSFDIAAIAKTLRIGTSGGASMPVEILKGFEKKYGIPIMEGYGLSETSPVATFNHLHKERKPGSIGTPIWGVEVAIFNEEDNEVAAGEVGEVVIRGHNVMKGYYNKPEATAEAFRGTSWFHTGDLGRKDEDGYFYIVDRVKDMIIRGGFNVYPREIEEVLMTHPAVSLAAVIGIPHEQHGEEIKAFVVPTEGATVSPEDIIVWAREQMAAYKYPRIVDIRNALPMTATGKILKKELKAEGLSA